MTSRTRPFRSATPVKVAPACVVLPFLTPATPWYGGTPKSPVSNRLVFWISKVSRFFSPGFCMPGKAAREVAAYSRKSGLVMPLRAMRVRSYAEETWPGAS